MQPAIVGSSSFGILWQNTYNPLEKWYAKPLVYTPPGQKQLVFTASNQNWIRTVDAVTGDLLKSRQVQPPFLQSDIGCTDMPNTIGGFARMEAPETGILADLCQALRELQSSIQTLTQPISLPRVTRTTLQAEV